MKSEVQGNIYHYLEKCVILFSSYFALCQTEELMFEELHHFANPSIFL